MRAFVRVPLAAAVLGAAASAATAQTFAELQLASNGNTGGSSRGLTFTPGTALFPEADGVPTTVQLQSITGFFANNGFLDPTGIECIIIDRANLFVDGGVDADSGIDDGDPIIIARSTNAIDPQSLALDDPFTFRFAGETLQTGTEYAAIFIIPDPSDAICPEDNCASGISQRRDNTNSYAGGGILFASNAASSTIDAKFRILFSATGVAPRITQTQTNESTGSGASGQTFTTSVGLSPSLPNAPTATLTSFSLTVGFDATPLDPADTAVRLGIFDGPFTADNLVGLSSNTVDLTTAAIDDELSWNFPGGIELDRVTEYAAIMVIDGISGPTLADFVRSGINLRRDNTDPYAGGGILFQSGAPGGSGGVFDAAFSATFAPASPQILQDQDDGSTGGGTRGQTFTPAIDATTPFVPGAPVNLTSVTLVAGNSGSTTSDTNVQLAIIDGVLPNGTVLRVSSNTVDVTALDVGESFSFNFDSVALDPDTEYAAELVVADAIEPTGFRSATQSLRRSGSNPLAGGGVFFATGMPSDTFDAAITLNFEGVPTRLDRDGSGVLDSYDVGRFNQQVSDSAAP